LYLNSSEALLLIDPGTNWESKIIAMIDPNAVEKEITLLKNFGYRFAEERPRSDGTLNELRDFWLKYALPDFAEIGDIKVTVLASVQDMGDDLVIGSLEAMQIRANMLESWINEFPRGRFVSTTKSGHFIHVEEPEFVIAEFQKLLSP
jgi:pimeloyl-ACP methyl ester carboxylesterase